MGQNQAGIGGKETGIIFLRIIWDFTIIKEYLEVFGGTGYGPDRSNTVCLRMDR